MRVARQFRPRKQGRVDQRSVIQAIFEHLAVAIEQCLDHAQVGHVAAGKQEGCGQFHKLGEFGFQFMVQAMVAGKQMRRPGPHAELGRSPRRFGDGCMPGQTQVIVAGKGQVFVALALHPHPLHAILNATAAAQALGFEVGEG